jgi:putative membrane protein
VTEPGPGLDAAVAGDGRRYKRLSPLTPLVRGSIVLVAVVGATWQDLLHGGQLGWVSVALIGVLLLGAVYGTASWIRTKYWIEGDELRVDTGVVSRQSRRIRIDQLQGVDIVQPFVARVLGLAELKMDVAGGGRAEGSLAFLPLAEAVELRHLLLARREISAGRRSDATGTATPQQHVLARLDLGVLAASIVLSSETLGFLVTVAVFAGASLLGGGVLSVTGFLTIAVGMGISVFRKLTGFYGFTVADTSSGLQVRRGLFERANQTVALHRVQGVVVTEPILWRPFGWARLDVSVAGSRSTGSGSEKVLTSTLLPVGPRSVVMMVARHALRGLDPDLVVLTPPPGRSGWLAPVGRLFMSAGHDGSLLVSRQGWFHRKTHAVPHGRVQSLRLSQGPLQRALRLADVHVDSPPGPVSVRMALRDAERARPLLESAAVLAREARRGQRPARAAEPRPPAEEPTRRASSTDSTRT